MRILCGFVGAAALSACQTAGAPASDSAMAALNAYYDGVPASELPKAPDGRPLPPADATLTRILVGSCNDEERESPALAKIAAAEADLFLMVGDNVYGDSDRERGRISNDPDLSELREAYADLAADPDFQAVRAKHPMMVTWDDHDFGLNDAGGGFPYKRYAERINEAFWGLEDETGDRPGLYYAKTFGPEGRRVQVVMLDTRYFRSDLTPTDEFGAKGKERYLPADGPGQDMLGEAQWAWLGEQLRQPADIRLIVSSIQVLTTDGHGFEHWNNLPAERDRLYNLVAETGAAGVVFVSGDRHTGFIYEKDGVLPYEANEITASSLNLSFRKTSDERDSSQVGAGVAVANYGDIAIDWEARRLTLAVRAVDGGVRARNVVAFDEIGL